ncbi:MAG: hypothetical protein D6722_04355 [Bacteroidetes bacterium]|nr:MAG: hypothetical protein D6722_04355 [Bacteroidota bacterium]
MPTPHYHEEARLQRWRIPGMIALIALPLGFAWMAYIRQGVFSGSSFETLLLISGIALLFLAGYTYYAQRARLSLHIDGQGIDYQMYPIHNQPHHIDWDEVAGYQVIRTSPLAHLSGWGVEFSSQTPCYSVCGHNGLALFLKNGTHLFIGSRHPERVRKVIKKGIKRQNRLRMAG